MRPGHDPERLSANGNRDRGHLRSLGRRCCQRRFLRHRLLIRSLLDGHPLRRHTGLSRRSDLLLLPDRGRLQRRLTRRAERSGRHRRLLRKFHHRLARQRLLARLADHQRRAIGHEPRDQGDPLLIAAVFIPGNEHAIRVTDVGLAVVLLELLRREHVFARGPRVIRGSPRFVEGIDFERALHLHRIAVFLLVEEHASAKASYGRLARMIHDRVGPHGHDFHRGRELAVETRAPGNALLQIKRRAARGVDQGAGQNGADTDLP